MAERPIKNNKVVMAGTIVSNPQWSHEVYGENFYSMELKVTRLSQRTDTIPLMMSDRLMDITKLQPGVFVHVQGQLRTFNKHEHQQSHLLLSLFARDVVVFSEEQSSQPNLICIEGYICRPPAYRQTPKGREVTDVLLAVNRSYNKSDYIPCIFWGRNARYAQTLPIGSHIKVWGRLQSRRYRKKVAEGEMIERVTYEVSANKLEYYNEVQGTVERVAES